MNYFELCWAWYEEYEPHIFAHPTKTDAEFEADVRALYGQVGHEYLAQERSWANASDWTRYVAAALPELGYVPIKPFQVEMWGNQIIRDEEGLSDGEIEFGEMVGAELWQAACRHNRDVQREVWGRVGLPEPKEAEQDG